MAVYQTLNLTETGCDSLANTSQVKVVWKSQQTGDSHNDNKKTAKYWVSVNGVKTEYSVSYTLPAKTTRTILSKTFTIPHAEDGTGSVTVQTWMDTAISAGEVELKKALTLTPIARASTIGAADAFVESTAIVAVNRKSEHYAHSVAFSFGELSGYLDGEGNISETEVIHTGTSIPFIIPASFYAQIPDKPSGVCTLTCRTYYGTQQVGDDQTATFTVTANPSLCAPVVSGTAVDVNPNTIALTGSADTLIRYYSRVLCTVTAEARNGASIVSKSINGSEVENSLEIPNAETGTFVLSAIDSRGYPASVTVSKTLIPYFGRTVKAAIQRTDPTGGEALLSVSGEFYPGSLGAADNALQVSYELTPGEAVQVPVTVTGEDYQGSILVSGLDYTRSYHIPVTAADKLGGETQTVTVKPGIPVFHWGQKDFAFHVPVYYLGELLESRFLNKAGDDMKGVLCMGGNRITGLGEPLDDLDAATRAYADGKLSLVKLWENASPTSTFYAQTVSLDLSGYDFVSVYYKNIPSGAAYFSSGIVPIGDRITMQYVSTSGSMYHRHGDVSESGIVFGAGQLNGEASNSAPVPLIIYGWKGVNS